MKAEDRVAYCEGHDWEEGCRLAREAIVLLREMWGDAMICALDEKGHEAAKARWGKCPYCDLELRVQRFLDGEGGET